MLPSGVGTTYVRVRRDHRMSRDGRMIVALGSRPRGVHTAATCRCSRVWHGERTVLNVVVIALKRFEICGQQEVDF